eukprot:365738-Chlamydomonas_euryale.AAC.6
METWTASQHRAEAAPSLKVRSVPLRAKRRAIMPRCFAGGSRSRTHVGCAAGSAQRMRMQPRRSRGVARARGRRVGAAVRSPL